MTINDLMKKPFSRHLLTVLIFDHKPLGYHTSFMVPCTFSSILSLFGCNGNIISFLFHLLVLLSVGRNQGWNFGHFLVLLGSKRLYSLSEKCSPSIPFPIEPKVPGTQSTRLRPQFHTESLIGKPMA